VARSASGGSLDGMGYLNYILLKNKAIGRNVKIENAQWLNSAVPYGIYLILYFGMFCTFIIELLRKLHRISQAHRTLEPCGGERFNDLHAFLYFLLHDG
jgi:hypothetical protein